MPSPTSPLLLPFQPADTADTRALPRLTVLHRRRLRQLWRSAGWPCHDLLELELLALGCVERLRDAQGRESLRVTDTGVAVLTDTLQHNRAARDAHERLVQGVAREMLQAGRLVWCGLSLRAGLVPPPIPQHKPPDSRPDAEADVSAHAATEAAQAAEAKTRWVIAMPDVYSVRHTTVEAYLQPVVHEIKVRRADLLSDLRNPAKRAAYLALASECWYVLSEGIGQPQEIPPECGVMLARGPGLALEVARPAPHRPMRPSFGLWMALARASPLPGWQLEDAQPLLGDTSGIDPIV